MFVILVGVEGWFKGIVVIKFFRFFGVFFLFKNKCVLMGYGLVRIG